MIYLISGDGIGAGKSTLAKRLVGDPVNVYSLADAVRQDLQSKYPTYDWFNKTQIYKDAVVVTELNVTVRQAMINHAEGLRAVHPQYWASKLYDMVRDVRGPIAIDDARKVGDITYFRERLPDLLHIHVCFDGAKREPEQENDQLREMADYRIVRG